VKEQDFRRVLPPRGAGDDRAQPGVREEPGNGQLGHLVTATFGKGLYNSIKTLAGLAPGCWPSTPERKTSWGYQLVLRDALASSNVTLMVFPRRHFSLRYDRRQRMWSSRSPRLVPILGGFRSSRLRNKAGG